MTRCTTWHVRIDVVEEQGQVTARGRLIGAPAAMLRPDLSKSEDMLASLNERLAAWRPLEDLGSVLAESLDDQHRTVAIPGQRTPAATT